MNFLDTITKTEHEAQKNIEGAREKARARVAKVEARENDEYENAQATLLQERETAIASAVHRADEEGEKMVQEAKEHVKSFRKIAEANREKANRFILESL